MDVLSAIVIYLVAQIILIWPCVWQTKVLLLVLLIVLVLLGFFAGPQLSLGRWR